MIAYIIGAGQVAGIMLIAGVLIGTAYLLYTTLRGER